MAEHKFFVDGEPFNCNDTTALKGLSHALDKACEGLSIIKSKQSMEELAFLSIPYEREDLILAEEACARIKDQFTDVVILGTGGSSLGAQALVSFVETSTMLSNGHPRLHFPDNLSPHVMGRLLEGLNLKKTHFLVISKSGATAETLAQFFVCLDAIKNIVEAGTTQNHFTVIVQPDNNPLRKLANKLNISILEHPIQLGGRFSVFSIVGLLPAMLAGMDVREIRDAAVQYLDNLYASNNLSQSPVVIGSCFPYVLRQTKNVGISFLMPYDSRLIEFTRWHQQLWAESIGKDGKGLTPVRAVGPLDQHSQLQLLLDGPEDKFVTIITENMKGSGQVINVPEEAGNELLYLNNRTIGDLVHAEALSTLNILVESRRPVRSISFESITAYSLGELMMHFMVETVLTAHLFDVNAYNQPAVEKGKWLTRKFLAEMK